MRLSLRFIIPLFLALGALAYAVVPLVDRLTLQWFERDLDLRATLIASTVQEPLRDLIRAGNRNRLLQFFTRILQDERLYALGFCPLSRGQPVATPTLPPEIGCAQLDSYSSPSGQLLKSPDGALLVSVRSLAVDGERPDRHEQRTVRALEQLPRWARVRVELGAADLRRQCRGRDRLSPAQRAEPQRVEALVLQDAGEKLQQAVAVARADQVPQRLLDRAGDQRGAEVEIPLEPL